MKLLNFLSATAVFSVARCAIPTSTPYWFYPENTTHASATVLPALYEPSKAQLYTGNLNSFWTCSYVTASNGHQYVVLGHTLYTGGAIGSARASIIDVSDPSYYLKYLFVGGETERSITDGKMDATNGNLTIKGLDDDSFTSQQVISNYESLPFNLSYHATSSVLYNGGLGNFTFGGLPCGEFAIPAAYTEGHITVNGTQLAIDPAKSFTWYDRQWGDGSVMGNYSWFQIHIPGTPIKASIWAIDDKGRNTTTRFATFRFANGDHSVLSFSLKPDNDSLWSSPVTNITYPTTFTLRFPGHGLLTITSIRQDQETRSSDGTGQPAYEGFSNVDFQMFGLVTTGYGLIEQVQFNG